MKSIVQKDTKEGKILRNVSKPVEADDIKSKKIQDILKDMHQALATQKDGVALAAPQIGVDLRIFVISPEMFKENDEEEEETKLVFINPEIIKHSKDEKLVSEGCLSVRWWYGKTRRHSRATVRAFDENGGQFEMTATGLVAQIFQHEIDHLNGILFVDHAVNLEETGPPEDNKEKDND